MPYVTESEYSRLVKNGVELNNLRAKLAEARDLIAGMEGNLELAQNLHDAEMAAAACANQRGQRNAIERAAREVDCACPDRETVLAEHYRNSANRWRACGEALCGAIAAANIRAMPIIAERDSRAPK